MKEKLVVFEEIFRIHIFYIIWAAAAGRRICYLRVEKRCYASWWFRRYSGKGLLERIAIYPKVNNFEGIFPDPAYEDVDKFFASVKRSRAFIDIERLYGDPDIGLIFKKALTRRLARLYYLTYVMGRLASMFGNYEVIFVPSPGIERYRTDGCEIYDHIHFSRLTAGAGLERSRADGVRFSRPASAVTYFNSAKRRLVILARLLAGLVWLCSRWAASLGRTPAAQKCYSYAFMMTSGRQFFNPVQKPDFLIDGKGIEKEESVFLSYNKFHPKHMAYCRKNGLEYIDDTDTFISREDIRRVIPICLGLWRAWLKEPETVTDTAMKAVYCYLKWNGLARYYSINNLITLADFGLQGICRNMVLARYGTVSWYYMDALNSGEVFSPDRKHYPYLHVNWGYLSCDKMVCYSGFIIGYMKRHHQRVKQYLNIGYLWAEHVRLIAEGRLKSHLMERLYEAGYNDGLKLIAVFDTTFHDDTLFPYEDAAKFLKDIYRMTEERKDVFIVLKQKKLKSYHRAVSGRCGEFVQMLEKISVHPRFCLVGWDYETSEMIAHSYITISFSFTSTTFEALAARRKAIWYDAANAFRGTFFDEVPGLVCHGYDELLKNVERLSCMSEEDYGRYLDEKIKGRLENYLDGRAITRFRQLLAAGKGASSSRQKPGISEDARKEIPCL
jgi:polysaccharide biosynthesis PFTS motif protein